MKSVRQPLSAEFTDDRTDLYIEGRSGILGGLAFGDTQVKFDFADGVSRTLYLLRAPTPDEVSEEGK